MPELKLVPKDGPEYTKVKAKELLEWAIEQGYESVIIMGFSEKKIHVRSSSNNGTLELIGALEGAKMDIWEKA